MSSLSNAIVSIAVLLLVLVDVSWCWNYYQQNTQTMRRLQQLQRLRQQGQSNYWNNDDNDDDDDNNSNSIGSYDNDDYRERQREMLQDAAQRRIQLLRRRNRYSDDDDDDNRRGNYRSKSALASRLLRLRSALYNKRDDSDTYVKPKVTNMVLPSMFWGMDDDDLMETYTKLRTYLMLRQRL